MPEVHEKGELPKADELEQLRELILPDEIIKLRELERVVERVDTAENVSQHIAEAVVLSQNRDSKLTTAFIPILEASLKDALRKHPEEFTNILFPLIGSTIRKSIAETFSSMLGGLSKSLEFAFSPKGIKWRVEAMRTGKNFSEVVMLHTLVYRVEQIYLIHSETGLVLLNLVSDGVDNRDADMVSGMLTAIQDFARDCFNTKGDTLSTLNSLEMGERTIYIERSPQVYIACVVRGKAPTELLNKIRESLELILAKCSADISDFNGDATPFIVAEPFLRDCFAERFVDNEKKLSIWMKMLPVAAALILALVIGNKIYHSHRMNSIVSIMLHEPGIVVFSVERSFYTKPWVLYCLKDEYVPPFKKLLSDKGFELDDVVIRSIPFDSHNPVVVLRKLKNKLTPPDSVKLTLLDGILYMAGTADTKWIIQAKHIAEATAGVYAVNTDNLIDPLSVELKDMIGYVEHTVIRFVYGKDIPIADDLFKLDNVVQTLVDIEQSAVSMGLSVSLTIYGHADSSGSEKVNYEISQARAKTIAAKLYTYHSGIPISIYGMGADYADGSDRQESRKVEFRVHLRSASSLDIF